MKLKLSIILILLLISHLSYSQDVSSYLDKDVGILRLDGRPCALFQLKDVANVGGTGNAWFALKNTHPYFQEIISVLLAAKMGGKKVHVEVRNLVVAECGHAEVLNIHLP